MHQFIILEDEILTLDTAEERATAREWMRGAGVAELPIHEGGPESSVQTNSFFRVDVDGSDL